jgi:hypothetical protein
MSNLMISSLFSTASVAGMVMGRFLPNGMRLRDFHSMDGNRPTQCFVEAGNE